MLASALHVEEWEQLLKPYILWWSLASLCGSGSHLPSSSS